MARLARVIHEVDSALRALIERDAGIRDVEVVFDAPTRDWAGRRTGPTIDIYLYDIREDLRRRERGVLNEYNQDQTRIIGRHLPPRHFKLSYLVTAWTQRPEDEHRLLSALLTTFLRFEALPPNSSTDRWPRWSCRCRSRWACHRRRTAGSPTCGRRSAGS